MIQGQWPLTASVVFNLGVTFLLQAYALVAVGIGPQTDAFLAAQAVPLVVAAVLMSGINNALVPLLCRYKTPEALLLVWRLAGWSFAIGSLATMLYCLSAPSLVNVVFAKFDLVIRQLTTYLAIPLFASAMIQIVSALFISLLVAQGRLLQLELLQAIPGILALCAIGPAIQSRGIDGLAWVLLSRASLTMVLLAGFCGRPTMRGSSRGAIRQFLKLLSPLVFGGALYKTGPAINRALAARGAVGDLSMIGFAEQISGALLGVGERVFTRRLLSGVGNSLSDSAAQASRALYRSYLKKLAAPCLGLAGSALLAILLLIAMELAAIIDVDQARHLQLATAVFLTVPLGLGGQFSAAYLYGHGRTQEVMRIASASFLFSVVIRVAGFLLMGSWGVVAGMIAYQGLNFALLSLRIERQDRAAG